MAFAPTKPWKWPCITRWDASLNRNQPTDSAEEAKNLFSRNLLWRIAIHVCHEELSRPILECDPSSICGDARIGCVNRRISELQTFRPIGAAAPNGMVRVGEIGDPLSVFGERRSDG